MSEIKDERQIMEGALLADKAAPEQLDQQRAQLFVAKAMKNTESVEPAPRNKKRFMVRWGSLALSAAAVMLMLLWLTGVFSTSEQTGNGTPAILQENLSIHATSSEVDSLMNEADSLSLPILDIKK